MRNMLCVSVTTLVFALIVTAQQSPPNSVVQAEPPPKAPPGRVLNRDIPTGVPWPTPWLYTLEAPENFPVGKPFEIKIVISPRFFDVANIEIRTMNGGGVTVLKGGGKWKGSLKKGESHEVVMTIQAAQSSDNYHGHYGIAIKMPGFYEQLGAFIKNETSGIYADQSAKKDIEKQIAEQMKRSPVYEEHLSTSLIAPAKPEAK